MTVDTVVDVCVGIIPISPALLLVALGVPSLLRKRISEKWITAFVGLSSIAAFAATVLALSLYVATGAQPRIVSFGSWFSLGTPTFSFDFIVDATSLGFATLSTTICGVVVAFSNRYLHREPGYGRYFVNFAMFALGIALIALAGSIEVLFVGWEFLGLSSALLVGFFHERRPPVVNALRIFAVYRASDAAMLCAAVLLHHWAGNGSLSALFMGHTTSAAFSLTSEQSLILSVLLIAAVAGKSALVPFSGWLPRAMEGPTPSSAVYYGAISIHAGCFLLLRAEPLISQSGVAQWLAALAGVFTTVIATLSARAQTDVKSALAYASLTQVGVIVVEISLGLTTIAFVHIVGHACFRLLQFLSAPNILHDLHALNIRHGGEKAKRHSSPSRAKAWLYVAAIERGFLDRFVDTVFVAPLTALIRWCDRIDRFLSSGRPPRRATEDDE